VKGAGTPLPEQLSLTGIEEPPVLTDSLFFALCPTEAAAQEIASRRQDLCGSHGLQGTAIAPDRLHITLYFLGEFPGVPQNVVKQASEAAAVVAARPFDITLDSAKSFPGKSKRAFVLGSTRRLAELMDFQKNLHNALTRAGFRDRMRGFNPHLTLLYDKSLVKEQPIDPVSWTASEFVLVRSLRGESHHERLARWPLAG
jgi:RNA 2',3'-cyclic 3'-phosphodiesterase